MPDLSITDSLGNPVDISTVNWTSASSLYNYLKSEALHLAVLPDYIAVKDEPLTQAVPKPTTFQLTVRHDFQLGGAAPEIDLTPAAQVELFTNGIAGSALFDGDPSHVPLTMARGSDYDTGRLDDALFLRVRDEIKQRFTDYDVKEINKS